MTRYRTFPIQEAPTKRVKPTLGYRGTRYAGWAWQVPGGTAGDRPTIQGTIEAALAEVVGHPVTVIVAGRTDAGVHAERQVISFDTPSRMPADGIGRVLGTVLPDDLWVVEAQSVDPTFDARRSALRRWYRYAVWLGESPPGLWRGHCLIHPDPLDVKAMRAACGHLRGRIDAASLATSPGRGTSAGHSTIRTVYAADWIQSSVEPLLLFEVCADAFLRQMVRTMVGSLLWVGVGRWSPDDLGEALARRDRRHAGPSAPAHGLTLWKIEYSA